MHKVEFVQENEIHEILRDFVIQTNNLIPDRRPAINKKRELAIYWILPLQQNTE